MKTEDHSKDRILLNRTGRAQARRPQSRRRSHLWTLIGGVLGSTILFWLMVQLSQASSEPKGSAAKTSASSLGHTAGNSSTPADVPEAAPTESEQTLAPPASATQGPGLDTPREVIEMLDLRKHDLDRREEAVRQNEERLLMVKVEIEQLLSKNELIEKRLQADRAKQAQQSTNEKTQQAKALMDRERQAQEQKNQHQTQLAKMYESMPAEEAAERLERMPDRKAIDVLRMVKGKTAGAILAQMKVDRAAKLTEQLLVQAP